MIELNQFDVQRILMMMPNNRLGSLDVQAFGNTSRSANGTAIYLRLESKDHRSFGNLASASLIRNRLPPMEWMAA
ncbi:Slit [Trichinella spiralis]|uniref:Slit n=1 Tax=Trichinella spiralis TaxID=6334 RepID=A0ABR3KFD1_TRISP